MFRMLRTNVEFTNMHRRARTIMVTSCVQGEGKSTTVANLAVAFARAGRRVVLVDLDLRRPYLHKFFPLPKRAGVTEVALGYTKLEDALLQVPLTDAAIAAVRRRPSRNSAANGNGAVRVQGVLEVLCTGPIPPDPGEFVASPALGEILDELAERADVVLIDSPPLLSVGDALTLSERVEAMIVLTRLKIVKRPMLNELKRVLDASPAEKLGFVVAAATEEAEYGYGYGYGYRYERKEERTEARF
jgi:Mrp family chromosome partitioning ATPase